MNEDPQFQYELTLHAKTIFAQLLDPNADTLFMFLWILLSRNSLNCHCFDELLNRVVYDWIQHCTKICCTLVARPSWVASLNLLELWSPWKMGACLAPLHRFAWTTTCCISHCLLIIGNGCRTQQLVHAKSQKLHLSLPLCLTCVRSLLMFFLLVLHL